jgi:hypothetical protein
LTRQEYYQLRPFALGRATEEWYNNLDDEVKEWVDKMTNEMIERQRDKSNGDKKQFGVVGAREALCALIAVCEGWKLRNV